MIKVTNDAIEHLKKMLTNDNKEGQGVRVAIEEGSCSDYSHRIYLDAKKEHDLVQDVQGIKIYMDPKTDPIVSGTEIDYIEDSEEGFKFTNPNAKSSCECGADFSV